LWVKHEGRTIGKSRFKHGELGVWYSLSECCTNCERRFGNIAAMQRIRGCVMVHERLPAMPEPAAAMADSCCWQVMPRLELPAKKQMAGVASSDTGH
jgi:hypothetical protein